MQNYLLCLLHTSIHKAEATFHFVQQFDQKTRRLNDIEGPNKDVASARIIDSLLDRFQKLLSVIKAHMADEALHQVAFRLYLPIRFRKGVDQQSYDALLLLSYLQKVLSIEQDGHVVNIILNYIDEIILCKIKQEVLRIDDMRH